MAAVIVCRVHSCHLLFDHFQFALIYGPDIPGSYAILLFTASDLASITSYIHNLVLFLLWLQTFILSGVISPLISSSILGTSDLGSSSFSALSFCLFILFMGFSKQEYWSGLPFPSPVKSDYQIRSDQISCSVMSDSATTWIAARQASLSITNSQSSLRLMSIESVMPSSHLILCRPLLLLPPIPPSIRVFSN